jgi:hypothetical protein
MPESNARMKMETKNYNKLLKFTSMEYHRVAVSCNETQMKTLSTMRRRWLERIILQKAFMRPKGVKRLF